MTKKLTKISTNKEKTTRSLTKKKPKLGKSKKKLTKKQQAIYRKEIKTQEKWVAKKADELKKGNTWREMYFTTWEGYIKLLEFEDVNLAGNNNRFNPNLPHIGINKLQNETVENIKESFRQIEIINSHLHKSYKQNLLDSDELKNLLLNLAHYQSLGGQLVTIDRNYFGTLLLSIGLKILLESVEPELKEKLLSFIKEFNDLNAMVQRLSRRTMPSIKLEYNKQNQVTDIMT